MAWLIAVFQGWVSDLIWCNECPDVMSGIGAPDSGSPPCCWGCQSSSLKPLNTKWWLASRLRNRRKSLSSRVPWKHMGDVMWPQKEVNIKTLSWKPVSGSSSTLTVKPCLHKLHSVHSVCLSFSKLPTIKHWTLASLPPLAALDEWGCIKKNRLVRAGNVAVCVRKWQQTFKVKFFIYNPCRLFFGGVWAYCSETAVVLFLNNKCWVKQYKHVGFSRKDHSLKLQCNQSKYLSPGRIFNIQPFTGSH